MKKKINLSYSFHIRQQRFGKIFVDANEPDSLIACNTFFLSVADVFILGMHGYRFGSHITNIEYLFTSNVSLRPTWIPLSIKPDRSAYLNCITGTYIYYNRRPFVRRPDKIYCNDEKTEHCKVDGEQEEKKEKYLCKSNTNLNYCQCYFIDYYLYILC